MTILAQIENVGRRLARRYLRRQPLQPNYDPYDKNACERRASRLLAELRREPEPSPVRLCQRLLRISQESFPTAELRDAYFAALDRALDSVPPRVDAPGRVLIGLGPGRCGSTSLSAILESVTESCITHETPPPIWWDPEPEQIDFHVRRLRKLAQHHSLVADVSHWWLNVLEQVFEQLPDASAVGLIRDPALCAASFMPIQGFGRGSFNPWAPRASGIWRTGYWDATYPSFPLPSDAEQDLDGAKLALITRYVSEYNAELERLARKTPHRLALVRTEALSSASAQDVIFTFAGAAGRPADWRLNVNTTADGTRNQVKI